MIIILEEFPWAFNLRSLFSPCKVHRPINLFMKFLSFYIEHLFSSFEILAWVVFLSFCKYLYGTEPRTYASMIGAKR